MLLLLLVVVVMVRGTVIIGAGTVGCGGCCSGCRRQCRQLIVVRLRCGRFLKLHRK